MKPVTPAVAQLPVHLVASQNPVIPRDKLLRLPQVEEVTGCKKSTIYSLVRKGLFPKPINITRRMAGWSEAAVLTWVQARLQEGGVQ